MTDHADTDALVDRAARGDADAFRRLYEEFARRLQADLEMAPSDETTRLADSIKSGNRSSARA